MSIQVVLNRYESVVRCCKKGTKRLYGSCYGYKRTWCALLITKGV
jgi:hypothetical protein